MNVFTLSPAEGKPSHVVDYQLDFLSVADAVKSADKNTSDAHFTYDINKAKIKYVNSSKAEGVLNFYLCRFANGECHIHIFGKLISQRLQFDIKLGNYSEAGFDQLHDRIGYILLKSHSMLKRYYKNDNIQSIQDHLLSYIK